MTNEWNKVTKEFEMTNEALLKMKSSMGNLTVSMIALNQEAEAFIARCSESHGDCK